jgi:hypothetical protein
VDFLDEPPGQTRAEIQAGVFACYLKHRAERVERDWAGRSRRDRRGITREYLAAEFDAEHLAICETCWLAYPDVGSGETLAWRSRCCDSVLIGLPEAVKPVPLGERLRRVRDLLVQDRR